MGTIRFRTLRDALTAPVSRRSALGAGGIGVAALAAGGAQGQRRMLAARGEEEFASGGLGLTEAEWEDRYGPGEVGQGAMIYEIDGQTYALTGGGQQRDAPVVASIFWAYDEQGGATLDEATEAAARFLPEDAELLEDYFTPAAGITPFLLARLYRSRGLRERLQGSALSASGRFLVAYALEGFDPLVLRVNAFVGSEPED